MGNSAFRNRATLALLALRAPAVLEAAGYSADRIKRIRQSTPYTRPLVPGALEGQLLSAIQAGQQDEAIGYLNFGLLDVKASDEVGLTLLHHAAQMGMRRLANELIDRGANPRAQAVTGETVLSYAVSSNADATRPRHNLDAMTDLLLQRGARADEPDGVTAMLPEMYAALAGDVQTLHVLKGHMPGFQPLTLKLAAREPQVHAVRYLLWAGVDPRPLQQEEPPLREQLAPHAQKSSARGEKFADVVAMLARGEVLAQAREYAGLPVIGQDLHFHIINNRAAYCQVAEQAYAANDAQIYTVALDILGDMHGYPHLPKGDKARLLMSGVRSGEEDTMQEAIEDGASPDTITHHGRSSLHVAVMAKQPRAAQLLLEQLGANPNIQDVLGMSPLMHAAIMQQDEMIRLLLVRGANPLLTNWQGLTARQLYMYNFDMPKLPQQQDDAERAQMGALLPPVALLLESAERHWQRSARPVLRRSPAP